MAGARVVYDHQIFEIQEYGGISRYFVELAAALRAKGLADVRIAAALHLNEYLHEDLRVRNCVWGLRMPRLRYTTRLRRFLNRYALKAYVAASRPGILHRTYYGPRMHVPNGVRILTTVHDMIHERFPEMFEADNPTAEWKRREVLEADHVICVSENTKRDLVEITGIDEARVSVVYHGIRVPVLEDRGTGDGPNGRFLLYVGHRPGYKNFERMLEAFASSPRLRNDLHIVCVGGGPFGEFEERLMRRLKLAADDVTWRQCDDRGLAELYRSAALFVYPSLYEGFGLPPLEAMAVGCPVAASNASAIPEIVADAAEMFDPTDVEMMRTALERVVYSETRREELVEAGWRRVERFSWERCAVETARVYDAVM